jgi:hypothetical protein
LNAPTALGPVLFDSEGDHVIVVAADARRSTVFRVDLARGSVETMTSWKGHDVSSASIARTGHVALGDTNGDVAVVDPSSRTVTEKAARLFGAPAQVGFDIATDVLAVAAQGQLALYDLRSDGVLIHERVASVPVGFQPTSLEFAPPGSVLVVGDQRGVLSFWNVASLTEITRVRAHDGPVLAVRVSPDGSRMASLAPGSLRLGGGFIPASVALAERMTRLGLDGGDTGPLDAAREQDTTSRWPTVAWQSKPDPAAAEFWRLAARHGIRPVRPAGWWQWLRWSGSIELSAALIEWQKKNPDHPLVSAAQTVVIER